MKFEVETKFNVGDFVYIPELYHHEWFALKHPFEIYKVVVKIYNNTINICYELLDETIIECREDFLFASYEECKQWCETEKGRN